jgi:ribonuclease HII
LDLFDLEYQGQLLAGVDEVGRGPLAGDVVAAAVILDADHPIEGLRDSKKLSEKKRDSLAVEIRQHAVAWSIGRASVAEIDEINILQASLLAMKRAVEGLGTQPEYILVDGNRLPQWSYASQAIIKGDDKVAEIAAASILAKVQRDTEMKEMDLHYPGYGLAKHKGYPTKAHLAALVELGVSDIHRRSFSPVKALLAKTTLGAA